MASSRTATTADRCPNCIGRSSVDAYGSCGRRYGCPARSALLLVLAFVIMGGCSPSRIQPPVREENALDQAPECLRPGTAEICDRLLDEFRELNQLAPGARATGVMKVGPSGDGRNILTASILRKGGSAEFARGVFTTTLCSLRWIRSFSHMGQDTWRGTGNREGWLLDLIFVQESQAVRVNVAIFAPIELLTTTTSSSPSNAVACSTLKPG